MQVACIASSLLSGLRARCISSRCNGLTGCFFLQSSDSCGPSFLFFSSSIIVCFCCCNSNLPTTKQPNYEHN
ncbi:hypothetical protein ACQKWADRAFT_289511, partial [Trichoderma austrokoningii]